MIIMKDEFVNLHLHSDYSTQDSVIKIPDLLNIIKEYGQQAVAITDHGSVEAWTNFYLLSQNTDIKPIFGCEFYCKDSYIKPSNRDRYHLIALAKNDNGVKTINKLQFESTRHFYYKNLLPYPFLFENTDDIFISTACSLGTIGQSFDIEKKNKNNDDAEIFLNKLLDVFGKDNVALEFQFHPTWKSDKTPNYYPQNFINEKLLDLWDNMDLKYCIVTTDAHFITDSSIRDKLLADAWNKSAEETNGTTLKSNCVGNSELVKSFAEESNFSDLKLVDDMIHNTSVIADMCNVNNVNNIGGDRVLPRFNKHRKFKKIFFTQPKKVI